MNCQFCEKEIINGHLCATTIEGSPSHLFCYLEFLKGFYAIHRRPPINSLPELKVTEEKNEMLKDVKVKVPAFCEDPNCHDCYPKENTDKHTWSEINADYRKSWETATGLKGICVITGKPCEELCPDDKMCDLFVKMRQELQLKGPDGIALKVRFILLNDAIVFERLIISREALGPRIQFSFQPVSLIDRLCFASSPDVDRFESGGEMRQHWMKYTEELTAFAEVGCFHSNERPVPRIEKVENRYHFYDGKESPMNINTREFKALSNLAGKPLPVYKKPKFASEWKEIYPSAVPVWEFTIREIPQ